MSAWNWTETDSPACSVDPATVVVSLALSLLAPNPARGGTVRATLSLARPAVVRAVVIDAPGRTVALVHDGLATGSLVLALDSRLLRPGVYTLSASTPGGSPPAVRRFTVVR